MSYKENREWSDGYMPSVKSILGQAIISESTFKQDTEEGFDLITPSTKRIACRVRDYDKYKQYMQEFTIRSRSEYNKRTEIHKILDGFGDWMFYGFTKGDVVIYWSIIDLDVFRNNYENSDCVEMPNYDGTKFTSFKLGTFPPSIIVDNNFDIHFNLEKQSEIF
tara:strand:- start:25 stop:516 length:492 start_codon:yes stop_codon:yes gene_type:complete